jgi:hypothetical protein
MSAANLNHGAKSNETRDLRPAVSSSVGLRRREESAAMNATLRLLTDSVGSFEERVFELVQQFAHRFAFINHARTLELADEPRWGAER